MGKILCITEKPSVAKNIAAALPDTFHQKKGYLEGSTYMISWCVGHLVEPARPDQYREEWAKWNLETLPLIPDKWSYVIKEDTKDQYEILQTLMADQDVTELVCATDAGREGELIFRLVYEMAGCRKPVKRLWISSMEEQAIRDGFKNMKPASDCQHLYESALCRQRADWLVGINGTRLYTVLYGGRTLKVGRVQTPTLAMLIAREQEIRQFRKKPYYQVQLSVETGELKGLQALTDKLESREKAEAIAAACQGRQALVTAAEKTEKTVKPPELFDLTTLQREANRLLGYTAKQTLEYTQSLYEKKLATYPRTDSRYLSEDMADTASAVIHAISRTRFLSPLAEAGIPPENVEISRLLNSKKVTDHHAVIPTVQIAKTDLSALPEGERRILGLLAARLLSAAGEKHRYESVRADLTCSGYCFTAKGKTILSEGWKAYEMQYRELFGLNKGKQKDTDLSDDLEAAETEGDVFTAETALPAVKVGQTAAPLTMAVTEHMTTPPKRYTENSLLAAMEKAGSQEMRDDVERKGLGTPATRADIIEKLVNDGYIRREKKQMVPTETGIQLIRILPEALTSPQLTADWENTLAEIASGTADPDTFLHGIEQMVKDLTASHPEISEEEKKPFAPQQDSLGNCPNCGKPVIKGKYGIYCTGKCGMSFQRILGTSLTEEQIRKLLSGSRLLLKGLRAKSGSIYDAYVKVEGAEPYAYTNKEGKEINGYQYKIKMEFPEKGKKKETKSKKK